MFIFIFRQLEYLYQDYCNYDEMNQLLRISSTNNQTKMVPITSKKTQKRKFEM